MSFIDKINITLEHIDFDHIIVVCNFHNVTGEWPQVLTFYLVEYKFSNQEAMEANTEYAGRARYVRQ